MINDDGKNKHKTMSLNYLKSSIRQFDYYRQLGEKAMLQLDDAALFYQAHKDSNSIAIIVKHLWGNMRSRWTNFLTEDGEKPWRERDTEFEQTETTRIAVMEKWNEGWQYLMTTLHELSEADLSKTIYIRQEAHTVLEAINRQIAHYAYHVGQIVFIAKMLKGAEWQSLSIPRKPIGT